MNIYNSLSVKSWTLFIFLTFVALGSSVAQDTTAAASVDGSKPGSAQPGTKQPAPKKPVYYFPKVKINNSTKAKTFIIKNSGGKELLIAGVTASSDEFDVTFPKETKIAPGDYTTFTITFKPKTGGKKECLIVIQNNDEDEANFEFKVVGFGIGSGGGVSVSAQDSGPEIEVFVE